MRKYVLPYVAILALVSAAAGHDTWVQTNTNVVRAGEAVHVDLMLGNLGNDYRDFKLAGKVDPAGCTLEVLAPGGKKYDLRDRLADLGYTPKEGYWSASFTAAAPGLYLVASTSDHVVSYAPKRSVKSAKTCFVVSAALDKVPQKNPGFDRALGHALELVPEMNPVTPMGPGLPIKVQLLYKGKPLPNAKVSFIPRGETLAEGFDKRYERMTDEKGRAGFNPTAANYYLVVAHWDEPKESGKNYDSTKYSATLTIIVPQICPRCGE